MAAMYQTSDSFINSLRKREVQTGVSKEEAQKMVRLLN